MPVLLMQRYFPPYSSLFGEICGGGFSVVVGLHFAILGIIMVMIFLYSCSTRWTMVNSSSGSEQGPPDFSAGVLLMTRDLASLLLDRSRLHRQPVQLPRDWVSPRHPPARHSASASASAPAALSIADCGRITLRSSPGRFWFCMVPNI
jgi:hypothetical protein